MAELTYLGDQSSTSDSGESDVSDDSMTSEPITLNVGGTWYSTLPATLVKYQDSLLADILKRSDVNSKGHYFIDRDGGLFQHILTYLRTSKLCLPDTFKQHTELMEEAKFYRLTDLESLLQRPKLKGQYSVIEVIEIAHPEKLGTCSARLVLKDSIAKGKPFSDFLSIDKLRRDIVMGVRGRYWIKTDQTRSDWSEHLLAHNWSLMGVTSFTRKLPDVSGSSCSCLCYVAEKWQLHKKE